MIVQSPWYVLGAGSIGCLFAAYLQRAGVPVVVILRDDAALTQWRARGGIQLQRGERTQLIAVPARTATQLSDVYRILICTKAHQTLDAVKSVRHALAPDALMVLLQNGMGVRELLQPQFPNATFLHALSTEGAYQTERFHVVHAGRGSTVIGAIDAAQFPVANAVAAALHCELEIKPVNDIETRLWLKLAVNSVINPLTALHECRNGELLQLPNIESEVSGLCSELSAVASAAGQKLSAENLMATAFDVMRSTAQNRSSMLQDIERGRRTEIDFINGYIVRTAQKFGLQCPKHESLLKAVQQKEQRMGSH